MYSEIALRDIDLQKGKEDAVWKNKNDYGRGKEAEPIPLIQ